MRRFFQKAIMAVLDFTLYVMHRYIVPLVHDFCDEV